jgi:hypothetical protein
LTYLLKGILPAYCSYHGGVAEILILLQISLLNSVEETHVSLNKATCMRWCSMKHVVSQWEMSDFWKGVIHAYQNFQCGERHKWFQIGLFIWVEETHVSLERTPSVVEVPPPTTVFPCEIWLSVWVQNLCKSEFSSWKGLILLKQAYWTELKKHMYLLKENHQS